MEYSLTAAAGTDPGQLREINQDNVLAWVRPRHMGTALGLLVVADGMGGHKAGEIASKLAVETIRENLAWMIEEDDAGVTIVATAPKAAENGIYSTEHLERRLRIAIQEANRVIYEYARNNPSKAGNLGCTTTCAIIYQNAAIIANVGDSRTYRMRDGELTQLTNDHSYVWQLVQEGYLEEGEIFDHPQRNVITRALGSQPKVNVDIESHELQSGDRLLLCSDGMWEMIRSKEEITTMLMEEQIDQAVDKLIEAANTYGGHDNIGVVVAELRSIDDSDGPPADTLLDLDN